MAKKRIPLGKRIAALRSEKGWTQRRLTEEMERVGYRVGRGFVAGVEAGHVRVPPKFASACEEAFDLEPGTLLRWAFLDFAERQAKKHGLSIPRFVALVESAMLKPMSETFRMAKEFNLPVSDYTKFVMELTESLERQYESKFGREGGDEEGRAPNLRSG